MVYGELAPKCIQAGGPTFPPVSRSQATSCHDLQRAAAASVEEAKASWFQIQGDGDHDDDDNENDDDDDDDDDELITENHSACIEGGPKRP